MQIVANRFVYCEAITQIVAVLDTQEFADSMNRVERGFGLRVVKEDPVRDVLVRIGERPY